MDTFTGGQPAAPDPHVSVSLTFRTDARELDVLFWVVKCLAEARGAPGSLVSVSCNTFDLAEEDTPAPGQTGAS